jgi:polysaccharide transporter, PST family
MTLLKTSFFSAIATIVRMINGFIVIKIIAIYGGPTGLALIGQLQSVLTMTQIIGSGAINNGVIKYTAEYGDDILRKKHLWNAAVKISLMTTIPVAFVMFVFSDDIALIILKSYEYTFVFKLLAITLIFFVLNSLMLSILNGQKEIVSLTIITIIQSFISLILTIGLVYFFGLKGALSALVIGQSIVFFVALRFFIKKSWFGVEILKTKFDKVICKKLLKFSLMALTSAVTVPVSQLFLRNYIGENLSWNDAGYWDAITRVSSAYLMVITTTLSIYYLPKLSSIIETPKLRREIWNGYKFIMPLVIIGAFLIYFLKDQIIVVLFTKEFLPIAELFFWQLIGDVLKIGSWLLGNLLLAKAMAKLFIGVEIVFATSFVVLSLLFVDLYGLIGITMSYALNYLIAWISMYFLLRKYIN